MILVCGEALIDFVPRAFDVQVAYLPFPGGSPYNVAIGLGRLGVPVGFLGRAIASVDAAIEKYVVDGAVNGPASITWNSGRTLRRVQTGHIQAYLYGALGGAIAFVIIQYVIR